MLIYPTDRVKKIAGGFSGLFGAALSSFFGAQGHDFQKSGIMLKMNDGTDQFVFMSSGGFVADEAALHAAYCCKGASGLKCCLLCANIFNYRIRPEIVNEDASGLAQHHTTHDYSKLRLHTLQSIEAILRILEHASHTSNKAEFEELEKRLGWNYVPDGAMWNQALRPLIEPTSHAIYDWMHIVFVHGVFGVHMGQTMIGLKEHGVTYAKLHDYVTTFEWPRFSRSVSGKDACAPKRAKSSWDDKLFKATASEALSLAPVFANFFRHFLRSAESDNAKGHAGSFLQLIRVVELILKSARYSVAPVVLQEAIARYLEGFHALYGPDLMITKFHYLLHLPKYLQAYGFLPNCFVHERKHRMPERFANQVTNITANWERSVHRDVTCNHIHVLCQDDNRFNVGASLIKPYQPSANMKERLRDAMGPCEFEVSNCARAPSYEQIFRHDVVLYKAGGMLGAGRVEFITAVEQNGDTTLVVGLVKFTHVRETLRGHHWTNDENVELVLLSSILGAVAWNVAANGHIFMLTPLCMR